MVQLDEPCLVLDLDRPSRVALHRTYARFAKDVPGLKIMLATYFGAVGDNLETVLALPVAGVHLDLVRAPEQLSAVVDETRKDLVVSLGVVDGRNVWRSDLSALLDRLTPAIAKLGADRVQIASCCSMLHVPIDVELETDLDLDVKSWLAFSVQKIGELAVLARALAGDKGVADAVASSDLAATARQTSPKIHDPTVARRMAEIGETMRRRTSSFANRTEVQRKRFALPAFLTTTIGSFPQTADVRNARAAHARGKMSDAQYEQF